MALDSGETLRWRRLRWRLRGAWQWPAFALFLVVDSLLLHLLPIAGAGTALAPALLLAGFLNLAAVAALAPLGGRWLRRRRPDLPRVVASDYAGTTVVLALAVVLVGLGVLHRPAIDAQHRAFRAQSGAVRGYVLMHEGPVYRRNLDRADSWKLDDNLFRTCVPGPTRVRALCLFVDTGQSPPGVRLDPNPVPNRRYFGPHATVRMPG